MSASMSCFHASVGLNNVQDCSAFIANRADCGIVATAQVTCSGRGKLCASEQVLVTIQDNHLAFPIPSQDSPLDAPFANLRRRSKETSKLKQTRAGRCRYQPSYQPLRQRLKPDSLAADAQWKKKRKARQTNETNGPVNPRPPRAAENRAGTGTCIAASHRTSNPSTSLKSRAVLCQCHCHGRLAVAAFPTTATTACKGHRTTGCDEQRTGADALLQRRASGGEGRDPARRMLPFLSATVSHFANGRRKRGNRSHPP